MKIELKGIFPKLMASIFTFSLILTLMNVFVGVTFAQEIGTVPEVDIFEKVAELILNWESMGTIAKGSLIVMILTQVVKQISDFEYKNIVVAVLAIAYGVFEALVGDVSVGSAIVTVMFSGGGAVFLYNALKPILKKIPFFSFLNLGSEE